ncbi:Gluconolactonase [Burkholderiales bacterium 8X]|nr:Gluconolactonase [Burkholderiales bacterium 8X]
MWTVLQDSLSQLGESPFWHPIERSLYWLDIPGRQVLRTRGDIASATVERWAMPSEPGCMAPARRGGLVIALRDGIYRADEWGGELRLLAAVDHDVRTMRFNDGKCDPEGRFWAGSMNEKKDSATAALYCLESIRDAGALLTRMANEATTANGLAFANGGRRMYWADTPAHVIRTWRRELPANRLHDREVFKQFEPKPAGWTPEGSLHYDGRPDGATIDAEGCYWVAMYEGGQLMRFSPAGELLSTLAVPVQCPTMPCFGGDDLQTLFVTTARQGRPQAELAQRPASGQVLSMRVDVPGVAVHFFDD